MNDASDLTRLRNQIRKRGTAIAGFLESVATPGGGAGGREA
jgi:hypothetical protein